MSLPSIVIISKQSFQQLFEVTKWYSQMPDCLDVPSTFHEDVREFQIQQMPDMDQYGTNYYISHYTIDDQDRLFVIIGDENCPATNDDQYTTIQIIGQH